MVNCLNCNKETKNKKYCSRSCSASSNNKGVRRHGKPKGLCVICESPKKSSKYFTCGSECATEYKRRHVWPSKEDQKARNALAQSKYRAKKYRVIDPKADPEKIKLFYLNRPEGYEVDHIIPLSKGGRHHEDNLQYLLREENRSKGNKLVGPTGIEPIS